MHLNLVFWFIKLVTFLLKKPSEPKQEVNVKKPVKKEDTNAKKPEQAKKPEKPVKNEAKPNTKPTEVKCFYNILYFLYLEVVIL